jgi:hypothetical protein
MKKVIVILSLLCAAVFAQNEQKVAVYVTGDFGANEKKALGNKMLSAFVRSGHFKAIENEDAFLSQIKEPADNRQISSAGKQAGASHVCIADITQVLGSYQVSARLINVETATITNMGESSSPLRTIDDLSVASDKVVANMFSLLQPQVQSQPVVYAQPQPQPQQPQPIAYQTGQQPVMQPQPVAVQPATQLAAQPAMQPAAQPAAQETLQGYGVRASIGLNSFSTGGSSKEDDKYDMGFGFGIGLLFKSIPIMPAMTFNPEVHFLYRQLYSMSDGDKEYGYEVKNDLSEFALGGAALVQYSPVAGTPIYITGGLQLDIPFSSETNYEESQTYNGKTESESGSEKVKDRKALDIGLALGAGYNVSEKIRADFRAVIGFTTLTGKSGDKSSFNQYGLGAAYFF